MDTSTVSERISVPEPGLTPDEMIARIRAMRPQLLDEQEEADRRGHYSPDVHEQLQKAGFYRCLQPRRFGGYEFDVPTFFTAAIEIARGGPGSGWCATLAAGHALPMAAHFSEEAQRLVFGPDGEFRAPHRAAPGGVATRADGGYIVNGQWRFSSGIPYATHFMGTTIVPSDNEGDPPLVMTFVVPRGEYTMLEDWGGGETLGLRASGSNTVVLKDCFVPDIMVSEGLWMSKDTDAGSHGTDLHRNSMYLGRTLAFYMGELISVQVGAAYAALDEYERLMRTIKARTPLQPLRIETPEHQRVFGLALSMTEAAQAVLIRMGELYMEYGRQWEQEGRSFTPADDLRLFGSLQQAGKLCWEAVELLYRSADSSVVGRGDSRLQRYYRDVSMYRGHGSAQYETTAPIIASAYLGLPFTGVF